MINGRNFIKIFLFLCVGTQDSLFAAIEKNVAPVTIENKATVRRIKIEQASRLIIELSKKKSKSMQAVSGCVGAGIGALLGYGIIKWMPKIARDTLFVDGFMGDGLFWAFKKDMLEVFWTRNGKKTVFYPVPVVGIKYDNLVNKLDSVALSNAVSNSIIINMNRLKTIVYVNFVMSSLIGAYLAQAYYTKNTAKENLIALFNSHEFIPFFNNENQVFHGLSSTLRTLYRKYITDGCTLNMSDAECTRSVKALIKELQKEIEESAKSEDTKKPLTDYY